MDEKIKLLIAIGAAVAANCIPCLQYLHDLAPLSGATEQEILEAIGVGKTVRNGAASKTENFAYTLFGKVKAGTDVKKDEFGCNCM